MEKPAFVFGIQQKLTLAFIFFAVTLFLVAGGGLHALSISSFFFRSVTENELPRILAIQDSIVALTKGRLAVERTLSIDNFSSRDDLRGEEAKLVSAIVQFDTMISALTWGSQSAVFRNTGGGLNYIAWKRMRRESEIARPDARQLEIAGEIHIYFGGFAKNALAAVSKHKTYLRLTAENKPDEAARARAISLDGKIKSLNYSVLVIEEFDRMIELSNNNVQNRAATINALALRLRSIILVILSAGIIIFFYGGFLFVKKSIIIPLRSLVAVAQKVGLGDFTLRSNVHSDDEIGKLASVFNQMADALVKDAVILDKQVKERTMDLTKTNKLLKETLEESYQSAKLLVRKDRELIKTIRSLEDRNKEAEEIGKILVRSDMELTRANERLLELDLAKSEFVSIAAHQLRTPLTELKWINHAILSGDLGTVSAKQQRMLRSGYRSLENLIKLVNDLLNVARLEGGKMGFEFTKQSILPIIYKVVKQNLFIAKNKGVKLTLNTPDNTKIRPFEIDEEKLYIAIDNLVGNAIKFTSPGGKVAIEVIAPKKGLRIIISDTGIGIPKPQFNRVFTKFFRGENSLLYQTPGTGLGLYMTKRIIEQHGGSITFDSTENKGTVFAITFPA